MNKRFYKKIVLSMLIAGVTISNVSPLHTFATEQVVQNKLAHQEESNKKYSLGPEGLQNVIEKMTSSALVMDSYAQTIRKQQETDLSKISSINSELRENMIKHQKDAQTNAAYWLDAIKPHITDINQNIINYNDIFQAHYSTLLTSLDQKDIVRFKNELERLYHSILENKKAADKLLEQLKTFRNNMAVDTKSFKEDSNQLTSILESTNAGIPLLQQQINSYNDSIKKSHDMIIAGGVLCATGILCLAGGPMIATAKKNISSAEQEIQKLKLRISGSQEELVILTDVKNKTVFMTETIDTAINSLQDISDHWYTIGAKYNSLIQNVEVISPEEFTFIKQDLNTAKDSWQDIKNYANKLSEGTKIIRKAL
ncbi:HBL/NHE enterotoxin family protein [Paenibacillus sp. 102]|uniref:non-hemolytic enterotoxin subunit C n=1 Tax=Paenibacillus sp. 102 TaxID=3120823 RepID=UPI0031BA71C6